MEHVLNKWQLRINRSENVLSFSFLFENKKTPVVIVDSNYWTFDYLVDNIPIAYFTNSESIFRYKIDKIERQRTYLMMPTISR